MNNKNKQDGEPELPTIEAMDGSGMWFAAAVLFAVLAAGTIVYRVANDDVGVALSDTAPSPASHLR